MLRTWAFYDATGGGAMISVVGAGSSLTIQEDCDLVGYASQGLTDVDELVMTVAGDTAFEASGIRFPTTYAADTRSSGDLVMWLKHRIPLKANSVMTLTSVSGAAAHYFLMYVDDRKAPVFQPPIANASGKAMYVTLNSAASGANTTAATAQFLYATTTITNFSKPRHYVPVAVERAAAATGPNLFVGISKGNDNYITWWPVSAAADGVGERVWLPSSGMPSFVSGERCNIHWISDGTEQPTAAVTFAYAP